MARKRQEAMERVREREREERQRAREVARQKEIAERCRLSAPFDIAGQPGQARPSGG